MENAYNIEPIISSLLEYTSILLNITNKYNLDDVAELLYNIKNGIKNISIENIESIKLQLNNIDDLITKKLDLLSLSSREQSLINRGYTKEEVLLFSNYTKNELEYISKKIEKKIIRNEKVSNNPVCIYLGGQPGCGKSTKSRNIKKSKLYDSIIEIGLDNYRTYHPNYLEIEYIIKKHWENRQVTENDSPGNDIADFTHKFAGDVTDILINDLSDKGYNLILEWGMRNPENPLNTMKELKEKGYTNKVDFIAVHKNISKEACKIRADSMNNHNHIIRRVPGYFHELCIESLPESCQKIYEKGYIENNYIDEFNISDRSNNIIWNLQSNINPKNIYNDYLNDIKLSNNITNDISLSNYSYNDEIKGIKSR